MTFRTIEGLDVRGKRVLLRVDLNVPMADGKVTDNTRIVRQAPTIRELADKGARVIILAHFERPGGKVVPSMSLKPVVPAVAEVIGRKVAFAEDCIGPAAESVVAALKDGEVLILENTRFHKGEEKNDPDFARELAALGDIYVNDAFSAAHRAHASTEGVAKFLPAYAGRAMESELSHLEKALAHPERPLMAVVGGAKVSSKIDLLENLVGKVDTLVIGGAMANTFLAAQGLCVGKSLHEADYLETARKVIKMAADKGCALVLPSDVVVAGEFRANAPHRTVSATAIGPDDMALDVGPATIFAFKKSLAASKTLVWNGPFGAFEIPPFDKGTVAAAKAVADATKNDKLLSVAGGGDTVAALAHAGVENDMTYVSTAGGAFLEWLEGKTLPGVEALKG
jgi:phosphoglycerate kinase